MSTKETVRQEGIVPSEPSITDAAHFEYSVPAPGIAVVANAKPEYADDPTEHTYAVNVSSAGETTACSCPADEYHAGPCKHRQAVESESCVVLAATADREGRA